MRKILKNRLFHMICAMLLMFVLVSCGDDKESNNNKHVHEIIEEITKEPTCVETGIKKSTCTICGETKVEEIETKPHSNDDIVTAPTCKSCGHFFYTEGLKFTLSKDGKSYSVNNGGKEDYEEIIIPSNYQGIPVTNIGSFNDSGEGWIKKVSIPESVISVYEYAFLNCSIEELITPMIDFTFLRIKSNFWQGVSIGKMIITNGEVLNDNALEGCRITRLILPDSLIKIGNYAFSESSLAFIKLPGNLKSIGEGAFFNCESLFYSNEMSGEEFVIPDSVTTIGKNAFSGCDVLKNVKLPKNLTFIDEGVFSYCGRLSNISIPNSVTSIEKEAFYDCDMLENITLPEGLTNIGEGAFSSTKLKSIMIPDTVTSIGEGAFSRCFDLVDVKLSKNIKRVSGSLFAFSLDLEIIEIPDGVETIDTTAFSYSKLKIIIIPSTVTTFKIDNDDDVPYLPKIYYRGSQEQWELIANSSNISYIAIEYEYED